jgi:hypothetical protein
MGKRTKASAVFDITDDNTNDHEAQDSAVGGDVSPINPHRSPEATGSIVDEQTGVGFAGETANDDDTYTNIAAREPTALIADQPIKSKEKDPVDEEGEGDIIHISTHQAPFDLTGDQQTSQRQWRTYGRLHNWI